MDDHKVEILLEDLLAKFQTIGEGLEDLKGELKEFREETNRRFNSIEMQNRQEHQQLMLMIKEINNDVQVELKRVK